MEIRKPGRSGRPSLLRMQDFNCRVRMATLVRHLGTCDKRISAAELEELRETQ